MTDSVRSGAPRESSYFRKGCNPYAQTGRSKLQSHRVSLNQQIIKAMRLRTGAENLLRASDNPRVREAALLELSFVNSNLQLLKEELEGLNGSVGVYQSPQESLCLPLIPLGLKETKEVDFVGPFKDFIQEHYGENPADFEDPILDLMDLRQATRTPSRSEAGVELLSSYYSQLGLLEGRFFVNSRHPGLFFTWYDSFTGLPVCQQHLSLEKASVLFNMAALHTQLGARTDRCCPEGLRHSVTAFQRAAGVLQQLRETYTHTPSFDLSPVMQNMLVRLMRAQAQECAFEETVLLGTSNQLSSLLRLAQDAATLSDTYGQVNQCISQPPVTEHVPPAWCHTVQVKLQHYRALAHYFVSIALLDQQLSGPDDVDQQEKALSDLYPRLPEGLTPLTVLRSREQRQRLGKAHLRVAIAAHEEALRLQSLCKSLKKMEIFQEILRVSHKRSLTKYTELQQEDDFDMMEAPDIVGRSRQQMELVQPQVSSVTVVDLFQKLGPPAVFSARQRWTAPRKIHLKPGDWEQGFTLQGEAAVQVTGVEPSSVAAALGLRDGDVIVTVAGTDCKWSSVSEVVKMLREMPADGMDIQVVSPQGLEPAQVPKCATFSSGLSKTYSLSCWALDEGKSSKGKKVSKKLSFLSWGSKGSKAASVVNLPSAVDTSFKPFSSSNLSDGSSLY
ncbi:rhophilin-2 [Pristis pectinata]|uniref:rhophilin-2 n=1 Tax=Pristis pectinata TaxID=685728 RepID=UPI00223DFFBD|nr:rhophilin-2 [Pristis pectinata]